MVTVDKSADLKTIILHKRAEYFRHYYAHLNPVDYTTQQLALQRFPCNVCSTCYPTLSATPEFDDFTYTLYQLKPMTSYWTFEAFRAYLRRPTRGTIITILENIAFRSPPKNPERLVAQLLEGYQFEISHTEVEAYPTDAQLAHYSDQVNDYLKRIREREEI